jgi:hypothetical protein
MLLRACGLACVVLLAAPDLRAQPSELSDYEQETIDLALERHAAKIERSPAGKRIEAVDIDVLEVIEDRDPAPNFLNYLHTTTKDYVIRREVLFRAGETWDPELVEESARNLRGIRQESLVLIVPLRGSSPDTVRVLVIVKDIWSLRLNSDYVFREGQLEYLLLQPSEENLAGTHRRISGLFIYEPDTVSVGARFIDPRMAGSRYTWFADANFIVNHSTGDYEGTFGSVSYGLPLYSTRQKWSWGAVAQWRTEVTRQFIGTCPAVYDADADRPDCKEAQDAQDIPYIYDTEILAGRFSFTRSFGEFVKNDVTPGFEVNRSVFLAPDLRAFDPVAADEFRTQIVPPSETRNAPFLQWHFYLNDYISILDVETMGLQENFLVGPEIIAKVYPIAQIFGSTRDVLGSYAAAAYTQPMGTGFGRAYLAGVVEKELTEEGDVSDAHIHGGLHVVTPPFFVGRLVWDGTWLHRFDNFSNDRQRIGGDGRLRGFPSRAFQGENLAASNLEFRSRSVRLWTVYFRGTAFYDVADAFDDDELDPKQGAGFGFQLLFPQLERSVLRVDWGFAIFPPPTPPVGPFSGLILTFGQAFATPLLTSTGVSLAR